MSSSVITDNKILISREIHFERVWSHQFQDPNLTSEEKAEAPLLLEPMLACAAFVFQNVLPKKKCSSSYMRLNKCPLFHKLGDFFSLKLSNSGI